MTKLESLRHALPDAVKDLRLNLQSVLESGSLSPEQRWGVAIASAMAARSPALRDAVIDEARRAVNQAVIEDALAGASLMAMNNVYYRFRHMVGKSVYSEMPARLRMTRLARPATNKLDFELVCLAVSAINGCEACIKAHEKVVFEGGLTEEQVHDAVRIAATVNGVAVALEASGLVAYQEGVVGAAAPRAPSDSLSDASNSSST
jgi:alkyl hydroperoxide reductase subunit D